ncbi:hypothetical protein [Pseudomonas sp. EL_65y_Pfl1_R32]|uniref:hypothetical protein n=1 Tax=Pseudomonas sp. EL_65y_Pfl1_R32 TaxID=3088696 RepID=UPI0030DC44A5
MSESLMKAWEVIAQLPVGGWAVIGGLLAALLAALIAALVSLLNTRSTLNVQRLANARSVSTFIADKRQKWIDDLRDDTSRYLSLSLETAEAWKQLYRRCGNEHDEHFHHSPQEVLKTCDSLRINFLRENAARDSEHHQIYMRIILRLNTEEISHQHLMTELVELRTYMGDLAKAAVIDFYSNQELLDSIAATLSFAAEHTKIILKEEWQRLKREVADPDRLMHQILSTNTSEAPASGRLLRKPATGVASSLSQETQFPSKA